MQRSCARAQLASCRGSCFSTSRIQARIACARCVAYLAPTAACDQPPTRRAADLTQCNVSAAAAAFLSTLPASQGAVPNTRGGLSRAARAGAAGGGAAAGGALLLCCLSAAAVFWRRRQRRRREQWLSPASLSAGSDTDATNQSVRSQAWRAVTVSAADVQLGRLLGAGGFGCVRRPPADGARTLRTSRQRSAAAAPSTCRPPAAQARVSG